MSVKTRARMNKRLRQPTAPSRGPFSASEHDSVSSVHSVWVFKTKELYLEKKGEGCQPFSSSPNEFLVWGRGGKDILAYIN
jgi:hypothetical protein